MIASQFSDAVIKKRFTHLHNRTGNKLQPKRITVLGIRKHDKDGYLEALKCPIGVVFDNKLRMQPRHRAVQLMFTTDTSIKGATAVKPAQQL